MTSTFCLSSTSLTFSLCPTFVKTWQLPTKTLYNCTLMLVQWAIAMWAESMLESGDMQPSQMLSWVSIGFGPRSYNCYGTDEAQKSRQTKLKTRSNIGRDKSFVDDLNKERGIVSMRVAFVPRSAEIQPLFWRFVTFTLLKPFQYGSTQLSLILILWFIS